MRANCSRPPSNEAAAKRIAATLDATPAQVALAWLLAHYGKHPADPRHRQPVPPLREPGGGQRPATV